MRTVVLGSVLLLFVAACGKGSKKGARLASERLQPHVAQLDGVDSKQVTVKMDEEIVRNLWFGRGASPGKQEWRCFVDLDRIFCDHGEGRILTELVAYRRLGDNRASIDDPAWVQMVRHAFMLKDVFEGKPFPIAPGIKPSDLRVPRIERPNEGGVYITLFALDANDKTIRLEVDVTGEGDTKVKRAELP